MIFHITLINPLVLAVSPTLLLLPHHPLRGLFNILLQAEPLLAVHDHLHEELLGELSGLAAFRLVKVEESLRKQDKAGVGESNVLPEVHQVRVRLRGESISFDNIRFSKYSHSQKVPKKSALVCR